MKATETFLNSVDLSAANKETVRSVLSGCSEAVQEAWIGNLQLKDGRISGTDYGTIQSAITHKEFVELYEAIGYDFAQFSIWYNRQCYRHDPTPRFPGGYLDCDVEPNKTCDPQVCHP
jgi:hypothetical protein